MVGCLWEAEGATGRLCFAAPGAEWSRGVAVDGAMGLAWEAAETAVQAEVPAAPELVALRRRYGPRPLLALLVSVQAAAGGDAGRGSRVVTVTAGITVRRAARGERRARAC